MNIKNNLKKILIITSLILTLLISIVLILRKNGFIFLLHSNSGCIVVTTDDHWINIINSKTAQDITADEYIPVSKLRFKKAKVIGCRGGI